MRFSVWLAKKFVEVLGPAGPKWLAAAETMTNFMGFCDSQPRRLGPPAVQDATPVYKKSLEP